MKKLLLFLSVAFGLMSVGLLAFAQTAPNINYNGGTNAVSFVVGATGTTYLPNTSGGGTVPALVYGTVSTPYGSTAGTAGRSNTGSGTFSQPFSVVGDGAGNLYVADASNNQIRKIVTSTGVVSLFAGAMNGGNGNTNGIGTAAKFNTPEGICIDATGTNLYVADEASGYIRKIVISTATVSIVNTTTPLSGPRGLCLNSAGTILYVADYGGNAIKTVTLSSGAVALYAGSAAGTANYTNSATLTAARFNSPSDVIFDGAGNLYIADELNNAIREINTSGVTSTFAGSATGAQGSADGTTTAARFYEPLGITLDGAGNFYVSDYGNYTIRKITSSGVVTTLTGTAGNNGETNNLLAGSLYFGIGHMYMDNTATMYAPDRNNNNIREILLSGYSYTGTLPGGLSFDQTTGKIYGTATTAGSSSIVVTAHNYYGNSTAVTVTINCTVAPPNITYVNPVITPTAPPYTFYKGITITAGQSPTPVNNGGAVYTTNGYAINTPLSGGLTFNTTTGVINGTPTVTSTGSYTVTASNAGGSGVYGPFTINVVLPPAPTSITYSPSPDYVFTQGTGISTLIPTVNPSGTLLPSSGAYVLTLTSAPATPLTSINGLSFNPNTGQLSGTPSSTQGITNYTVTVSNAGGSASISFNITINPQAPNISYAPNTANTWTVGNTYSISPSNSGGAVSTWSYTGTLPPGTTFAGGTISGIPTTPGSYSVQVTAQNVTGSSVKTVTFTVNYPNPVISYSPVNPYLSGASINLPVTNNEAAVTTGYTITSGSLPGGVSLNGSTGAISGTIPTVTTSTTYTATITANTGSSTGSTSVSIIVNPIAPLISYTSPGGYVVGTAIAPLSPNTSGGGAVGTSGTYTATTILTAANGLSGPYGMAVDGSGNVYVVNDATTGTVTEYSTTGTVTPFSTGVPSKPVGIVFDSSNNAYILTASSIVKFTGGLSNTPPSTIVSSGLSTATGIAIDGSGYLYVANSGNRTITKYDSNGNLKNTFTAPNSLFTTGIYAAVSAGITVDASGNIYVADNNLIDANNFYAGASVDIYNSSGTYTGSYEGGNIISGLFIDNAGNIYITDTGAKTVTEYTSGLTTLVTESGFNSPRGVVEDSKGNFYVSDFSNNTVTKYSPSKGYFISPGLPAGLSFNSTTGVITGVPQVPFPSTTYTVTAYNISGGSSAPIILSCTANPPIITYTPSSPVYQVGVTISPALTPGLSGGPMMAAGYGTGTPFGTGTLNKPYGMTTDASGNIWVANYGNKTVIKYSPAGAPTTFTVRANPTGVAVDGSGIFYVSYANGSIYSYPSSGGTGTPTGTLLGSTGGNANGIAIDATGNLYISDSYNREIWKYSAGTLSAFVPNGSADIYSPRGVAVDAAGDVFYVDATYQELVEYSPSGTFMSAVVSNLNNPYGLHIDANGDYYISDAGAKTVTEYNIAGTAIAQISGLGNPEGLTTDAAGNVYVSDYSANTVTKYVPSYYYTISPATLPAGMTFSTLTGAFGGKPTAAFGPSPFIISAYGTDGNASTTVTITCGYAPSFTYTPPPVYPVGVAIITLSPVFATPNGGGPLTSASVTTNGPLPAGLTLNPDGTITGTPTVASGPITYTVTGTNALGFTGTATVTITCAYAPLFTYTPPPAYQVGVTIATLSPVFATPNGGGPLTNASITTNGPLPPGLTLNMDGTITGNPTAASGPVTYTVTGTNSAGLTGTATVTITCATAPVFSYMSPQTYTVGTAISTLSATVTSGGPVTSYSTTGLPPGLSLNTTTGDITGTSTTASPATNYTITATNGYGFSSSTTINITCVNPPIPVITYTSPDVYTINIAITPLTPTNTGGPVQALGGYSAPTLPVGLSIDPNTGIISGTPTVVSPATNYPVTATNAGGTSVSFNINIACVPLPPSISYTSPDYYNVGVMISPLTPSSTGGAVTSWSINQSLPAGLTFDTTTGIISGTPTSVTAAKTYIVTATNVSGSATAAIGIEVDTTSPIFTYTTPDTYPIGSPIAPLVPMNTGGTPVSYSVSPGLPAGLSLNTSTGVITGTPTMVTAAANYTVTATNPGGSNIFVINIACVSGMPVFTYTTPNVFPVGAAITPLSPTNTGTAPTSYAINFALPAGLTFNTSTGIISGTPTATSAAANYIVTATDASSNTGTFTISIACGNGNDWVGTTSTDWNTATNWSAGTVPTAADVANIGVNVAFTNFPTVLTGETPSVGSVVIGTNGGQAGGITVNTGATLAVSGTISYQSDANAGAYTAALSGAGAITAGGINVTANTTLGTPASYTETLISSITSLALTSNVSLTSTVDGSGNALNATFSITGGTVSVGGTVQTSNGTTSTSTLSVVPATTATLQLAGAAPLSGLSATGTNTISFNNAGATIEYSGAMQTYYTNAAITGLPGGVSYNSIKFSGTGLKSPNGNATNTLNIPGDFTNALTLNDGADYIDLSTPIVNFTGTTQNIYAGNGTGTTFYTVNFNGTGTTTIQSGSAYLASTGVLTMGGSSSVLAAGGNLTLKSDVNGTATVAAIPTGCSITGLVNVQRYLTGGAAQYRGYRLMSSSVAATAGGSDYSLNYVENSSYVTGTTGAAGGFDAGGNPTLYLFRENLVPSNATFTSGNYRGINNITAAPSYNLDVDNGPFNIPVGNGFLFFFRGDRAQAPFATETTVTYIPTGTTMTETGYLNQGAIPVNSWYTPNGTGLMYTTVSGKPGIEGFNLVGNPYPSSIDWDTYSTTTSTAGVYAPNVGPFIYVMNNRSGNNFNVYQSGTGGVGTVAATGSNVIPGGQGFFVVANANNTTMTFNEIGKTNAQATAAQGNLFMGKPVTAAVPQYLRMTLVQDSLHFDGSIINFRSNASEKFVVNEDAPYRKGSGSVSLSSYSADNIKLAINNQPLPNQIQKNIPLSVLVSADGQYSIHLDAVNAIPALYDIWLKDAFNKDSLDIKHNPTYVFDAKLADTTTYSNRFSLVIRQNPALMVRLLNFNASKITGGDQVVWTTENEQNYTNFTVQRSTDGGVTFNVLEGLTSSAQGTYSYLDNAPANGANSYRLKTTDLNGTVTYSNVVTIMYANTNNQIATNGMLVYPNPTLGVVNLAISSNQAVTTGATTNLKPAYSIEIVNNLGAVIQTATSTSPNWQTDVSAFKPGTYFIQVTDTNQHKVVGKSAFVRL